VRKRWEFCPLPLKQAFIQAFTDGLHNPTRRVTEGEWQQLFLQLQEGVVSCPRCRAENVWYEGAKTLGCWNCSTSIPIPGRLEINTGAGKFHVLLKANAELKAFHLKPAGGRGEATTVLGRVVQNPQNPAQWGLRNLTASSWSILFKDGTTRDVPPQKSAPLTDGAELVI
jgi:hypothetical protein